MGDDRVLVLEAQAIAANADGKPGTIAKTRKGVAVACGEGMLMLQTVQISRGSGRPMAARDAANGFPRIFTTGRRFDVPR